MPNLLKASLTRIKKDRLFWGLAILTIVFALALIISAYIDRNKFNEIYKTIDFFPRIGIIIGFYIAIITSIFVGSEYSCGTIRNKIIMGHNRKNIYLANFIVMSIATLFYILLFILVVGILGTILFGKIDISIGKVLYLVLTIILFSIAMAAINVFVAMNVTSKTISSMINILLVVILFYGCMVVYGILSQPETTNQATLTEEGIVYEEIPNPMYPSKNARTLYQIILSAIPEGQAICLNADEANYTYYPLYSIGVIIIFTSLGIYLFNKKEIN